MKIKDETKRLMFLFLTVLCAGQWGCGGCNGETESDDGGFDRIETPDGTGDMDVSGEDLPPDDGAEQGDVREDEGPADVIEEEEGPSPIEWSVTDLGVSAVAYDIARDNGGNVHLIWREAGSAQLTHYGRIETGALVGPIEIPQSNDVFINAKQPRLAVVPDGSTIHACWLSPGWDAIYHIWRDESGAWRDRETVWTAAADDWRMAMPAIGADADGYVHIIAQHFCNVASCAGDNSCIAYWRKAIGDSPWSGWMGIQPNDPPGVEWRWCNIFTDGSGGIHAAWKSLVNGEGHYCHAPSGGSLEGCELVEIPVPDGARGDSAGSSFVTGEGDVYHAIWAIDGSYTIDVALKAAGSDTFTLFGRPSIDAFPMNNGYDPYPVIGVDAFDRIFVSWAHPSDVTLPLRIDTVYVSIYDGGAWNREIIDDDAEIDAQSRSVLAVTSRAAYLVWRTSGGNLMLAMADL